jgi:hypothetical protein
MNHRLEGFILNRKEGKVCKFLKSLGLFGSWLTVPHFA